MHEILTYDNDFMFLGIFNFQVDNNMGKIIAKQSEFTLRFNLSR